MCDNDSRASERATKRLALRVELRARREVILALEESTDVVRRSHFMSPSENH